MNQSKIYIGNLSYDSTEESVRSAFSQYGNIEEIILIKDRDTGRLKGFGFITFDSQSAAEAALAMDGDQLDGRAIKVSIAQEKKAGSGGGGRGGRNGGGGGSRW